MGLGGDKELQHVSESLQMGVRCDREGVHLIDYHTIGGGYAEPALLTAEGKPKLSGGRPHTEETWRHYLCDASFLVALQGEPSLIARIADALQQPRWTIFLGRRSCPPSRPPYDGVGDFPDLETALREWKPRQARAVIECRPAEGIRRRDELVSRSRRVFAPRYTRETYMAPRAAEQAADE